MSRASLSTRCLFAAWILVHVVALAPGFFAPFDPGAQQRERPFSAPESAPPGRVRLFAAGAPYRLFGAVETSVHLFGFAGGPVFLLGTDGLGRDQLSRLIHGAQVSLFAGLLAAAISISLGIALGLAAGYCGGWVDAVVMRATELFLALPWLYLLIGVRAFLPLDIGPAQAFVLVAAVIGSIGWVRPGRLIRGVVLSARERDYVAAARGFGASHVYLLSRHILPQVWGAALTQAALLIPQYVLAEAGLSFLGLGVAEPVPSLGNMLAALRQYHVMGYWWMYAPALALVPLFLLYQFLGDVLKKCP